MGLLEVVKELSYCLNSAIVSEGYSYDDWHSYMDGHSDGSFERRRCIMNSCFSLIVRKPIKAMSSASMRDLKISKPLNISDYIPQYA